MLGIAVEDARQRVLVAAEDIEEIAREAAIAEIGRERQRGDERPDDEARQKDDDGERRHESQQPVGHEHVDARPRQAAGKQEAAEDEEDRHREIGDTPARAIGPPGLGRGAGIDEVAMDEDHRDGEEETEQAETGACTLVRVEDAADTLHLGGDPALGEAPLSLPDPCRNLAPIPAN